MTLYLLRIVPVTSRRLCNRGRRFERPYTRYRRYSGFRTRAADASLGRLHRRGSASL